MKIYYINTTICPSTFKIKGKGTCLSLFSSSHLNYSSFNLSLSSSLSPRSGLTSHFYSDVSSKNNNKYYLLHQQSLLHNLVDKKPISVYLDEDQLTNYTIFENKILNKVRADLGYKVYIKFKFNYEIYKMAGHQFAFNYTYSDYSNIYLLFKRTNKLLDFSISKYGFQGMIDSVLLTFNVVYGDIKPITL